MTALEQVESRRTEELPNLLTTPINVDHLLFRPRLRDVKKRVSASNELGK